MDEIDLAVLLIVFAIGVFFIPERFDPQKLFQESRQRLGELIAGLFKRDFERVLDRARVVHKDNIVKG
jgi:hypothetical protein